MNFNELKDSIVNNIPNLYASKYTFDLVKEYYDNFNEKGGKSKDILERIVSNIGYTKIDLRDSGEKSKNYYDMQNKRIFLEPRCFDPKNFVLESVGIAIHETLHVYFSKGIDQKEYLSFIFDENKPLFSTIYNVFEDIRINNMSKYFYLRGQDYIKIAFCSYRKNEGNIDYEPKGLKIELLNYSIIQGYLSIGSKELNKFLVQDISFRDKLREIFPEETKKIDDFIEKIIGLRYNNGKDNIREDGDIFSQDLYSEIYHLIYDEENEQEDKLKEALNQLGESTNGNSKEEMIEELSSKLGDKLNPFKGDFSEELSGSNEFYYGFNDDEIIEGGEEFLEASSKNGKNEDENKISKRRYGEIKKKNSIHIKNLRSKLFQILEKRKLRLETGFNKGKTISSRVVMNNILKSKSGEIKRNQILNGSFKRLEGESNKILNVISICIDKSGSMYGNKIERSIETSVIIIEALKRLDTQITINSFDLDNYVIYDGGYNNDFEDVCSIGAFGGTSEINTLREVSKQFDKLKRKFENKYHKINGISIMLTDGFGDKEAKKEVEELRKKGIFTIGLGIDEEVYDSGIEEELLLTYGKGNYFIIKDSSDLIRELPKIIINNLK